MISTSTNATVELAAKPPAKAGASALLTRKGASPQGVKQLPPPTRAAVDALVAADAIAGKANEVVAQVVTEPAAHRVLSIGLGEAKSLQAYREAAATLAKYARRHKIDSLSLVVPDAGDNGTASTEAIVEALATGFLLGSFQFREFKGSVAKRTDNDPPKATRLTL